MKNANTATTVFETMKAIVEQPGYPYLTHYKDDFYLHDKATILNELVADAKFAWVVNPSGTHLTRIGVHDKQDEWALATIKSGLTSSNLGAQIYLVSLAGVQKVNEAMIQSEIKLRDYVVSNNAVYRKGGQLLAVFDIRNSTKPGDGNQYCHAMYQTTNLAALTRSDLFALRDIATSEAVRLRQSFFVKVEVLTVNGVSVIDLIEKSKATHAVPEAA